MKIARLGLLPVVLLAAFFISPHAHAATLLSASAEYVSAGANVSISWTTPWSPGCPESATIKVGTSTENGDIQIDGFTPLACTVSSLTYNSSIMHVGETTYLSFYTGTSTNFVSYIALTTDGSTITALQPTENTATRIIEIVSPAAYSTTSSPVPISFDIYSNSASPPVGYTITFVNSLNFKSTSTSGWLVDSGFSSDFYNTVFRVSTSAPLTGDGTWKMSIALWSGGNGGPEPDPVGTQYVYFGPSLTTWFGLNFNDNTQHVLFPEYATFQGYASTSCALNFSGTFSVSECAAYLFYPSPDTLSAYPSLYALIQEKIPFSYLFSVANTWQGLVASTTLNSPTYSLNLRNLGIGSTTPMGNLLPNFDGFSSTTVQTYLTPGLLALLKALASAALWLALFADIFFTVRNMMKH